MPSLLQSGYLSVLEAKTKDELEKQVVRFTQELGFQTVTAMMVIDHVLREPEFFYVDNAPAAYAPLVDDPSWGKRDPVAQHCKHKSSPIVWDQSTYVEAGQAEKWDEQAHFGYCHGISLALHLPEGRHFLLAVDRDQPLPKDPAKVAQMIAAVALFALNAQETAAQLLVPLPATHDGVSLTSRELETLRWTMEGKTSWETGRILGIAENTVVRHTQSASHKLGCSSKHHAVVKALRLGLIQ